MIAARDWRIQRLVTGLTAMLLIMPGLAAAQSYRPWVGLSGGFGILTTEEGADGGVLGVSIDFPFGTAGGLRVGAERLWASDEISGGISVQQLAADLVLRRPLGTTGACSNQLSIAGGAGLYRFSLESGALAEPTRVGYQLTVGGECVAGRVATGVAVGWRSIDAPDHVAFHGSHVTIINILFGIRIRL